MKSLSATKLEVMKHAFISIPEQMGAALQRSAYSPNIKERKDESCALFTSDGDMLAQAEHIPVHLGAMPSSLKFAVKECKMVSGDQIILNDPYSGGTHLPDITLIKPVFYNSDLIGYTVNRAHHADVGGRIPGSMPGMSKTLDEEGIIISPRHAVKEGEIQNEVLEVLKKARSPEERMGDIRAQIGANEMGAIELKKIVKKFGLKDYKTFSEEILNYSEKRTRKVIKNLPKGVFIGQDFMEWKHDIKLKVKISIEGEGIKFDFSGTDKQVQGNINAPKPVTLSAVYYVLRCLLPTDIPLNDGCYQRVKIYTPKGSVLNPNPPAAVSAGNVETSQRVVELILNTLREPLSDTIPAESQGTMNNLIIGNENFTYYETIGGGAGAYPYGDGQDGVHVHMTNTKNTPIESLENEYPLMVNIYKLRDNSGGRGLYKGGEGIIRELEVLEDSWLSIQSERRRYPPKGAEGGKDGEIGKNILINEKGENILNGKITRKVKKGEKIRIISPGGGGWGEEE
ncbi:MAG: hydantoinase B/oxoprolinase family protein [Thermoplasmatota archaeon]